MFSFWQATIYIFLSYEPPLDQTEQYVSQDTMEHPEETGKVETDRAAPLKQHKEGALSRRLAFSFLLSVHEAQLIRRQCCKSSYFDVLVYDKSCPFPLCNIAPMNQHLEQVKPG